MFSREKIVSSFFHVLHFFLNLQTSEFFLFNFFMEGRVFLFSQKIENNGSYNYGDSKRKNIVSIFFSCFESSELYNIFSEMKNKIKTQRNKNTIENSRIIFKCGRRGGWEQCNFLVIGNILQRVIFLSFFQSVTQMKTPPFLHPIFPSLDPWYQSCYLNKSSIPTPYTPIGYRDCDVSYNCNDPVRYSE